MGQDFTHSHHIFIILTIAMRLHKLNRLSKLKLYPNFEGLNTPREFVSHGIAQHVHVWRNHQ